MQFKKKKCHPENYENSLYTWCDILRMCAIHQMVIMTLAERYTPLILIFKPCPTRDPLCSNFGN